MMIVSKDGRVWIRRGIPRVVFSFPSRGRGINNRTRGGGERERGSSNYTTAGVILSRLRRSSINFRKHVSMHVDRHFFLLLFNYRPANEIIAREEDEEICILLFLFFFSGFSNFSSNLLEYIYIWKTDSNSSGQLAWLQAITQFLTWPFSLGSINFAFVEINRGTHEWFPFNVDWNITNRKILLLIFFFFF